MLKEISLFVFLFILFLPPISAITYSVENPGLALASPTIDIIREEYEVIEDTAKVRVSFFVFIPRNFNESQPFNITLHGLEVPSYSSLINEPSVIVRLEDKRMYERNLIRRDNKDEWVLLFSETDGIGLNYSVEISYVLANYIKDDQERLPLIYFSDCDPKYCPNQDNFEISAHFYPSDSLLFTGTALYPFSFPNYILFDTYDDDSWSLNLSSTENLKILGKRHLIWLENQNYAARWEIFLLLFALLLPLFFSSLFSLFPSLENVIKQKNFFLGIITVFIILIFFYLKGFF